MWSPHWKPRPLLSDGSTPRSPVIRCCQSGCSEASSTRRVVMPRSRWRWGDLYRLAAFLHGLPLRVGAALSLAERGGDIAALVYAVEPRSWAVQDPAQRDLRDRGLAHLRRAGAGQPALIGTALGLRDCIGQDGSRAAIRAALPFTSRSVASPRRRWRR